MAGFLITLRLVDSAIAGAVDYSPGLKYLERVLDRFRIRNVECAAIHEAISKAALLA